MTDQPEPIESAELTPAQPRSRWQRFKPQGRLGRVVAVIASTAVALVIGGSIFTAGYALGSDGHGHHHGGGHHSSAEADHHRGGDDWGSHGRHDR